MTIDEINRLYGLKRKEDKLEKELKDVRERVNDITNSCDHKLPNGSDSTINTRYGIYCYICRKEIIDESAGNFNASS